MRISDWSSDVCSSDLGRAATGTCPAGPSRVVRSASSQLPDPWSGTLNHASRAKSICKKTARLIAKSGKLDYYRSPDNRSPPATWLFRSEEHTSELQSLMRISYAVFCLKKKKTKQLS